MIFLTNLINGLSLGSVYAIIALGYTMVYGISKMLNFAHGDVIMVGAYISFCATSYLNLPAWVSVILAMIVCTALGILIEGLAYRPLEAQDLLRYSLRRSAYHTSCRTQRFLSGEALLRYSRLFSALRLQHLPLRRRTDHYMGSSVHTGGCCHNHDRHDAFHRPHQGRQGHACCI